MFDELRAGIRVTFTCGSLGSGGSLSLDGHSVAFSDGSTTYSMNVPWNLPHMAILAGVTYVAWLADDSLEVSRVV